MKNKLFAIILILISLPIFAQKSDKLPRYFADPILVDSLSTLMIPTRYNADLLSSSKIALWNDYYANIIFYDFRTDSSKRLFEKDTFIKGFSNHSNSYYGSEQDNKLKNTCSKWIFYFVKTTDYDNSGRVDNQDPTILFVSDKYGNGLKAITPSNENVVSMDVLDKQGIALIKMQRDVDHDNDFESDDKDFYYIRLDLDTLALGHKIEIQK
jgi:hypothetical protein